MLSALIRFSLKHATLILVLAGAVLVFAGLQTPKMPVDVFPDLNAPTVVVMTEAPGLSSADVEQSVTLPIETGVGGLPGLRRVRSAGPGACRRCFARARPERRLRRRPDRLRSRAVPAVPDRSRRRFRARAPRAGWPRAAPGGSCPRACASSCWRTTTGAARRWWRSDVPPAWPGDRRVRARPAVASRDSPARPATGTHAGPSGVGNGLARRRIAWAGRPPARSGRCPLPGFRRPACRPCLRVLARLPSFGLRARCGHAT